jgi:hypothetical protein
MDHDEKDFGEEFDGATDPITGLPLGKSRKGGDDEDEDFLGGDDDLIPLEDEDLFAGGGFDSFDPNY